MIYLVSRKISRPILNLSDISKRMVNLDFDARYEGHDAAEISLLGENINTLSESLKPLGYGLFRGSTFLFPRTFFEKNQKICKKYLTRPHFCAGGFAAQLKKVFPRLI